MVNKEQSSAIPLLDSLISSSCLLCFFFVIVELSNLVDFLLNKFYEINSKFLI